MELRPSLKIILKIFTFIGLNPFSRTYFARAQSFIFIILAIYINVKNMLEIMFHWNGVATFGTVYLFPPILMYLVKFLTLYINNTDLKHIIEYQCNFWADDKFGAKTEKDIKKLHHNVYKVVVTFLGFIGTISSTHAFLPLMLQDKTLPFTGYDECNFQIAACYYPVYAAHFTVFIFSVSCVASFDVLFFYFVGEIYCTLQLLKDGLTQFTVDENNIADSEKRIDEFIEQHHHILSFILKIRVFYNEALLAQSWTSLFCYVYCWYMMTSEGFPPTLVLLIKYGIIYVLFAVQFFYYCLGGTIIMDQSLSVANDIYGIDWWKTVPPSFRKKLSLMIQRSQKGEILSAGKMVNLNLMYYVSILRDAFSMYSLLSKIQNKAVPTN